VKSNSDNIPLASETLVGEPLEAIGRLKENSFDVVVDTIGGKGIYVSFTIWMIPYGRY
jgi:hypothetical protein